MQIRSTIAQPYTSVREFVSDLFWVYAFQKKVEQQVEQSRGRSSLPIHNLVSNSHSLRSRFQTFIEDEDNEVSTHSPNQQTVEFVSSNGWKKVLDLVRSDMQSLICLQTNVRYTSMFFEDLVDWPCQVNIPDSAVSALNSGVENGEHSELESTIISTFNAHPISFKAALLQKTRRYDLRIAEEKLGISLEVVIKNIEAAEQYIKKILANWEPNHQEALHLSTTFQNINYAIVMSVGLTEDQELRDQLLQPFISLLRENQPLYFNDPASALHSPLELAPLFKYLKPEERNEVIDAISKRLQKLPIACDDSVLNPTGVGYLERKRPQLEDFEQRMQFETFRKIDLALGYVLSEQKYAELRSRILLGIIPKKYEFLLSGDKDKCNMSTFALSRFQDDWQEYPKNWPQNVTLAQCVINDLLDFTDAVIECEKTGLDDNKWKWCNWRERLKLALLQYSQYLPAVLAQRQDMGKNMSEDLRSFLLDSEFHKAHDINDIEYGLDVNKKTALAQLIVLLNTTYKNRIFSVPSSYCVDGATIFAHGRKERIHRIEIDINMRRHVERICEMNELNIDDFLSYEDGESFNTSQLFLQNIVAIATSVDSGMQHTSTKLQNYGNLASAGFKIENLPEGKYNLSFTTLDEALKLGSK